MKTFLLTGAELKLAEELKLVLDTMSAELTNLQKQYDEARSRGIQRAASIGEKLASRLNIPAGTGMKVETDYILGHGLAFVQVVDLPAAAEELPGELTGIELTPGAKPN